jgi:predicted nuclease with TOPRIM domain
VGTNENLKEIIRKQKEALSQLEAECRAIESSDTVKENAALKSELSALKADYKKAKGELSTLSGENAELKNALFEQIYTEKMRILNIAAQKLNIYFKSNIDGELNRLAVIETAAKARINGAVATLKRP